MTRFVVLLKISIVLFGFLFLTQQYLKSFAYQQEIWKSTTEKPEPKASIVLQDVLYFNRIPKTGSENFVFLMSKLSKENNFTHYRYSQPDPRHLTYEGQRKHIKEVMKKPQRPLTYDRHVHFIDFTQFIGVQPIWFSIIRDPVDKFVSRYFYNRGGKGILYDKMVKRNDSIVKGQTKEEWIKKDIVNCIYDENDDECNLKPGSTADLAMPYFCGQNEKCSVIKHDWALENAKLNIEKWYPVIGTLEDLETTFFVLENKLPQFFKGISKIYFEELNEPHKNRGRARRSLPKEALDILRGKLSQEYELYQFIKQRLKSQSRELKLWRKNRAKIKPVFYNKERND